MATRKFRKSKPRKTVRRRRSSTAGKILPPLDVRTPRHLKEFEKRIKKGPITIILVYADWCGHCHTMMPHFDAAAKSPNRSIQAVKVNDTMLEKVNDVVNKDINRAAKPLNVEGYPSIIVVDNKGNKVTDLEPVRNTETMKSIMENAGPLAENAGLNTVNTVNRNENPTEVVNSIVKKNLVNLSKNIKPKSLTLANVGVENVGTVSAASVRKNINVGEDELKGSIASEPNIKKNLKLKAVANLANAGVKPTNEVIAEELKESIAPSPLNAFSAPKGATATVTAPSKELAKEAEEITSLAAPITPPSISSDISESISNKLTAEQKVGGGRSAVGGNASLISALTQTTYKLAPTAALLATAAYVIKGKKHTRRRTLRRKQKTQKTQKRR